MLRMILGLNYVDAVSIAVVIFLWIISTICTCWLCSFITLKHRKEIVSRRPISSILAAVLSIFGLAVHLPMIVILLNVSFARGFDEAYILTNILTLFAQSAPFHIFTYRAYMVYFDIKWSLAMKDQEWRLHIDPHEKNWFLRHKNTFGNHKFVGFTLFIHWSLWLIIVTVASFVFNDLRLSRIAIGGPGIISIICDFIIYLKFPKFDDLFGISDEITLTIQMEVYGISLYYILFTVVNAEFYTIEYALVGALGAITFFGLMMAVLFYPLKRFDYPACPCNAKAFFDAVADEETFESNHSNEIGIVNDGKKIFKI